MSDDQIKKIEKELIGIKKEITEIKEEQIKQKESQKFLTGAVISAFFALLMAYLTNI